MWSHFVYVYQDLACITGALGAKQGERGILGEARNECEVQEEGSSSPCVCLAWLTRLTKVLSLGAKIVLYY